MLTRMSRRKTANIFLFILSSPASSYRQGFLESVVCKNEKQQTRSQESERHIQNISGASACRYCLFETFEYVVCRKPFYPSRFPAWSKVRYVWNYHCNYYDVESTERLHYVPVIGSQKKPER